MEQVYYILILLAVVLLLLYYHLTSNYGYWKKKLIPHLDGAVPGLGHIYPMLFLQRNMADMFRDFYNRMPMRSMIGFYFLREPSLLIRDPELVKTVLLKNFQNFYKNNFEVDKEMDPLLVFSPFFISGEIWKNARQQLSSGFSSGKLKSMQKYLNEVCSDMKNYLNELIEVNNGKVELELKDLFSRYTADVVATLGYGADGGSFKNAKDGPFKRMGKLIFEPTFVKGLTQILVLFVPHLSKILRMRFIPLEVHRFFKAVVKDVLKQRKEHGTQRQDFLQFMTQYKNISQSDQAYDQGINADNIACHATSFFLDGYETSSITLSFLAYQLAAHPEIQDRMRAEVTEAIAKHGGLTYQAIQEMTYVDQVLYESQRLYPAFGSLMKICTEEVELVGSDGLTCQIAPGTNVVIPVSALHRDPKYWPNPEEFDPERFSEENKNSRHKFIYLPFGEGPRICIGMRMAMLLMKTCIATLIQNFEWEVSPRTKQPIQLDPNYFMSAAIGGLWMNVRHLNSNKSCS